MFALLNINSYEYILCEMYDYISCVEIVCRTHIFNRHIHSQTGTHGGVVVKALRYKPAVCGFDSRWCRWNFSVT